METMAARGSNCNTMPTHNQPCTHFCGNAKAVTCVYCMHKYVPTVSASGV